MIDIVSVILAEYETIPFSLLELLFARIIDPEKVFIITESRDHHFVFR
jgi:hypothetical protein